MVLVFFIIIPFIGSILSLLFTYKPFQLSKWCALFSMLLVFLLSLFLWFKHFSYFVHLPLYHHIWNEECIFSWIPQLGIDFHLALDKLSLMMLILLSIVGIISIICVRYNDYNSNIFYFHLLCMLMGTIGVLLSVDLFLFFCFWEMMLIPMYFLIVFYGNEKYTIVERKYTANQFLIYTQLSSFIMLVSILLLSSYYYLNYHIWTFNYNQLIHLSLPLPLEYIIMLGFFIAFAVKMPIFPFHGWLPNTHSQSPTNASVDLCGMLIKVASYGLLRFNIILFKFSSHCFAPFATLLGIITIFYGSWMAFSEKNIKKIIAYSSISHMGVILVAIYSENKLAYQGAVIQTIFGSLSTCALFILFSQIYRRFNISHLNEVRGIKYYIAWVPGLFLFFLFANLNFPGTANFIGEIMILTGILHHTSYVSYIIIFSLLFSVIYSLNLAHKIFYGPKTDKLFSNIKELDAYEFTIMITLFLIILLFGLFPKNILYSYVI